MYASVQILCHGSHAEYLFSIFKSAENDVNFQRNFRIFIYNITLADTHIDLMKFRMTLYFGSLFQVALERRFLYRVKKVCASAIYN